MKKRNNTSTEPIPKKDRFNEILEFQIGVKNLCKVHNLLPEDFLDAISYLIADALASLPKHKKIFADSFFFVDVVDKVKIINAERGAAIRVK